MIPLHEARSTRCLTCGYLLRGLPEPVCPECGRAFDPSDESTFDTQPPGWRSRRWMKRVAVAFAVAVLLFTFAPRGILKGKLTFVCNVCGDQKTYYRRELKAPRWMPFRYPSWHWKEHTQTTPAPSKTSCDQHVFDIKVAFDLHNGSASARMFGRKGKDVTFNGKVVTVAAADDILRHLMSPTNNGIGP